MIAAFSISPSDTGPVSPLALDVVNMALVSWDRPDSRTARAAALGRASRWVSGHFAVAVPVPMASSHA